MIKNSLLIISLILIASCSSTKLSSKNYKGYYKVGNPYQIEGVWYHPKEQPKYDETGIASWYGPDFHGKKTANGDTFDQNALTAAHNTLPIPSMVRVTNLENDKTIILMVNDRGPFKKNRVIDVSKRAAEILEFRGKGTAKVRVQFLEGQTRRLLSDLPVPTAKYQEAQTPEYFKNEEAVKISTKNKDYQTKFVPTSSATQSTVESLPGGQYIKIGTYSVKDNAQKVQKTIASSINSLESIEINEVNIDGKTLYKVKTPPIADDESAKAVLDKIIALGYSDAVIAK